MLWDLELTQTSARSYPSHRIHSGPPVLILTGLAQALRIPLTISYSRYLHFGTTLAMASFLLWKSNGMLQALRALSLIHRDNKS